ncbi:MAG TPA: hypothetical protein PKD45_08125 [Flavobacteriales bacterium]|nr:hypothetical protein [Flavobacteriales bacterium]
MQHQESSSSMSLSQILAWIHGSTTQEKRVLLRELLYDTAAVTIASEPSLSRDWDDPEEDEAWKDL